MVDFETVVDYVDEIIGDLYIKYYDWDFSESIGEYSARLLNEIAERAFRVPWTWHFCGNGDYVFVCFEEEPGGTAFEFEVFTKFREELSNSYGGIIEEIIEEFIPDYEEIPVGDVVRNKLQKIRDRIREFAEQRFEEVLLFVLRCYYLDRMIDSTSGVVRRFFETLSDYIYENYT